MQTVVCVYVNVKVENYSIVRSLVFFGRNARQMFGKLLIGGFYVDVIVL